MDDEVRNLGAVLGSGFELLDDIPRGVEFRGQGLDRRQRALGQVGKHELRRGQKSGDLDKGLLAVQVGVDQVHRNIVRQVERAP